MNLTQAYKQYRAAMKKAKTDAQRRKAIDKMGQAVTRSVRVPAAPKKP